MVPASRAAAGTDPASPVASADRTVGADGRGIGALIALTMLLAEVTDGDPDYGYRDSARRLAAAARRCAVRAVSAAPPGTRSARPAGGRSRSW